MKKFICTLSAVLLLALCGCTATGTDAESADAESTAESGQQTAANEEINLTQRKKSTRTVLYAARIDISPDDALTYEDIVYYISVSGCGAAVADSHTASELLELYIGLKGVRFELPLLAVEEPSRELTAKMEEHPEYFLPNGSLPAGTKTVLCSEFIPKNGTYDALCALAEEIYGENGWQGESPLPPMVLECENNRIYLTRSGYPVKYSVSTSENMADAEFASLTSEGIPYGEFLKDGKAEIYVQTEGLFGKSKAVRLELYDTAEIFAPGTVGVAYTEDFEAVTVQQLERHWRFDPEGVYEDVGQGGFYIKDGKFHGHWIYGRGMQLRYELQNYRISCNFGVSSGGRGTDCQAVLAIRQPLIDGFFTQMYETSGKDGDLSMGVHGIYITGFNEGSTSYMEVALHYADPSLKLGAGTVSAYFELPGGTSFLSGRGGVDITVRDEGEKIHIYCQDVLYCTVELSALSDRVLNKNAKYEGERYTAAKILSAEGEVLAECENADIPALGTVCFTERGNVFVVDDIEIELYK